MSSNSFHFFFGDRFSFHKLDSNSNNFNSIWFANWLPISYKMVSNGISKAEGLNKTEPQTTLEKWFTNVLRSGEWSTWGAHGSRGNLFDGFWDNWPIGN